MVGQTEIINGMGIKVLEYYPYRTARVKLENAVLIPRRAIEDTILKVLKNAEITDNHIVVRLVIRTNYGNLSDNYYWITDENVYVVDADSGRGLVMLNEDTNQVALFTEIKPLETIGKENTND